MSSKFSFPLFFKWPSYPCHVVQYSSGPVSEVLHSQHCVWCHPCRNVVIYNSDDTHYDLLVTRHSSLGLQSYDEDVSETTEATPEDIDVELEELIDVEEEDSSAGCSAYL